MRSENWNKIIELDDERREIQARIQAHAVLRKGLAVGTAKDKLLDLIRGHDRVEDAIRYVQIQDEQWALMGCPTNDSRGDEVLPL